MFKALLDLIGAFFGRAFNLGGRFVAIGCIAFACLLGWLLQAWLLGLWSGAASQLAWTAFLWFIIWITSSIGILLMSLKLRLVTGIMVLAEILLLFFTAGVRAPGTTQGAKIYLQHKDKEVLRAAEKSVQEVPSQVRCDKDNYQHLVFFTTDGNTGEKRNSFWYARNPEGGIECYDRPGFEPVFGKPLAMVDENIVRQIAQQEPPVQLRVAAAPAVVQPVAAVVPVAAPPTAPVAAPQPVQVAAVVVPTPTSEPEVNARNESDFWNNEDVRLMRRDRIRHYVVVHRHLHYR